MAEGRRGGVEEWLSPRARRELLEFHAEGNARIATFFSRSQGMPFFSEALPEGDAEWKEYGGLTAECEKNIREKVWKTALHRRAVEKSGHGKVAGFLRRFIFTNTT
jgi:hypothetical protein